MRRSLLATAMFCGVAFSAATFAPAAFAQAAASPSDAAAPATPPAASAPAEQAPDKTPGAMTPPAASTPAEPPAPPPPTPPSSTPSTSDQGAAPSAPDQGSTGDSNGTSTPKPMHRGMMGSGASNISSSDTHSEIAPRLPAPKLGPNSGPEDYLQAAKRALQRHRTGEAQEALEMAETRALDRSTPSDNANSPDNSPMVSNIHNALTALGNKDMSGADSAIDQALAGAPGKGMGGMGGKGMDDQGDMNGQTMHHHHHHMNDQMPPAPGSTATPPAH